MNSDQDLCYRVDPSTGILAPSVQCPSPNQDDRPEGCQPELIVVHGISLPPGEFGGPEIEQLFTNRLDWDAHPYFQEIRGTEVSSHLLIRRDGSVVQFVPFNRRAWHAGESRFRGRRRCNDFSLGIELEGTDQDPYTDPQYEQLAAVISAICKAYPTISIRTVAGHCDVSPGRKTDPGPVFDWPRLYDGLMP
ncbi:MAG: 1,6-anhydro-N-acetylmuramyl-L-alanine amidase AmpD [Gammaproteobacteria bacterium]|nr:1,6-anhydro-N-acetylmuramyl-L-alanine amidase AmpD [Gammaproteobacteria bacterium]MDH4314214.1 1,6-anhydro-N-acetylmuramyl-L-alanine amidase AmpD [Gammaproteobacteria bacterium]MDH5213245.1 1,6-anhydro-N-acetylmuramyl-L-alanine amidase AmpD [Gammaproteobacteria bacterium]MDH5499482.1 1,6-anhydro-N-acetylmuramyl-L-alanine amidase AmpD [Gammaproteobacteria bacterium]